MKFNIVYLVVILAAGLVLGDQDTESKIISKSQNLTVNINDTIFLPCLVKKMSNTIVVWNQCEDASCNEVRNLLTVDKENFIQDMRIRVVFDSRPSLKRPEIETGSRLANHSTHRHRHSDKISSSDPNIHAWNLEIRRVSKNDEGCYQCQLNSFQQNTIHYCIRVGANKITAKPKKVSLRLNDPLRLKCVINEEFKLDEIKWFKNGELVSEVHGEWLIEKKHAMNQTTWTSLVKKHAELSDAGIYYCKFNKLYEKVFVDVVINDLNRYNSSFVSLSQGSGAAAASRFNVGANPIDSFFSHSTTSLRATSSHSIIYLATNLFLILFLLV